MSMEYSFTAADGSEGKISSTELQNYMISAGIQAQLSPDGMTGKIIQNGQEFEGPVRDLVEQYYGKVASVLPSPEVTDYSTLDNTLKSGIAQFGSDSLKAKYLQIAMENSGVKDAKIVGSGDDWFRYDPSSGQYMALTNKPGAELSDVLTYAPTAARMLGSTIGAAPGFLASLSGVGAAPGIAAAAAGSAIGGQVGARGANLLQAAFDPNYAQALGDTTGQERLDMLKDMGVEVAGDALLGALPVAGPQFLKEAFAKGVGTRLAGFGARGVEAGGKAIEQIAKTARNSELARGAGVQFVSPSLGMGQAVGWMMQGPQWAATRGMDYAGRALEKMGKTELGQMLQRASTKGRGSLDLVEEGVNKYSNMWMPPGVSNRTLRPQARDTIGNLAEELAEKKYAAGVKAAQSISDPAEYAARMEGLARQRANIPKVAETAGRVLDSTATLGRGLEQTIDKTAKGALWVTEKGAGLTSGLARIGRTAADIAAPLELRGLTRAGQNYAEERLPWRPKYPPFEDLRQYANK